jgi:hypothetical protein
MGLSGERQNVVQEGSKQAFIAVNASIFVYFEGFEGCFD